MYYLRTIWQILEEYFFSASLDGDYEYLDFTGTYTTLLVIVGGLCIGILLASVGILYQKRVIGGFIRRLLAEGATDAAHAKTLEELGYGRSGAIKSELSRATVARKLVSVVDGENVKSYADELAAAFPAYAEKLRAEQEAGEKKPLQEGTRDAAEETPAANDRQVAEEEARMAADEAQKTAAEVQEATSETAKAADETQVTTETQGESKAEQEKNSFSGSDGDAARNAMYYPRKYKGTFSIRGFKPSRPDFERARFFIPEELKYRAEIRFKAKGNSWLALIPTILLVCLFFLLALRFIPVLVNVLDGTIGNILNPK